MLSLHPSTYLANNPGARAPIGLALLVAYELGMWFLYYRSDEGYQPALIMGFWLVVPAFAAILMPQLTDQPIDKWAVLISIYLSGSHFAYAIANWRKSQRSWLDL